MIEPALPQSRNEVPAACPARNEHGATCCVGGIRKPFRRTRGATGKNGDEVVPAFGARSPRIRLAPASGLTGVGATIQIMSERRDQLDQRLHVATQRGLARKPRFCVRKRFENASPMASGSSNNTLVDQEQENRRRMTEAYARPVARLAKVVFQVHANIPRGLFEKRCEVLVVVMIAVMGKTAVPGITKFAGEWLSHDTCSPRVIRSASTPTVWHSSFY